jgi:dienelactone hydrolase
MIRCAFIRGCFTLAAVATFELMSRSPASAEELVKFDSATPRLQQAQDNHDGASAAIQGYLTKPKGAGPFPAVILLHSCLGLPANRQAIASTIARWGYVALFVDDFATRGIKQTCAVDFPEGVSDAFGALLYLANLPYVDSTRIAAIGYSQGADTALKIAASRSASAFAIPRDLTFKAAAAFYPPCANESTAALAIPTLILIGASDDVTPAADCARLARSQPSDRSDVKLVIYPGAYHLFDDPNLADGMRLFGMWLKYDPKAAQESKSELRNFLATKLAR